MKKSGLLTVVIFLLLINTVYAGSKISIELNHQAITTVQGTSTGKGEVYTDNSQTTTAIATTVTTTKNTADTKFIASGTLARNPKESSSFVYNFIDGTSSWTHHYTGNYKMESTGVATVIEDRITTNDGSGTVNLQYIPSLSENYLSIDPYSGDFALSLSGCFDADSSGNPVADYSDAAKVLKWSTTTTISGAMALNSHDEGTESIGESGAGIDCGAYITGNVFTDTKEVNGDIWIVKVTRDDTQTTPSPLNKMQLGEGASASSSTTTTKKYDLTITMPRVSDDPDFNLDPLDISRPSDLDKLDISNDPGYTDFNFDPLDISRPSDLDRLDITVDNTLSENSEVVDIDYTEADTSETPEEPLPELVPLGNIGGSAIADPDAAQNKLSSINIEFKPTNNMRYLIVQGYYINESWAIKKLTVVQARRSGKELASSKEKLATTKEARQSIDKLFNDVKANKGKIINFYRIQPDSEDAVHQATIKFSIHSTKFSSLGYIKLIKIDDDGSTSEVPTTIEDKDDNKIITAKVDNFSYFIIIAEPKTNTSLFDMLKEFLAKLLSFFKT